MRIILNNIGVITVYLILLFTRCSNCSDDERWKFLGHDNVGISSIIHEDTISVNDSLYIEIRGNTINGDSFDNVELEVERDVISVIIGLYADIYEYNGCGIIPPTDLNPHSNINLLPPFSIGNLRLIANQPYGLDTVGIITVIP